MTRRQDTKSRGRTNTHKEGGRREGWHTHGTQRRSELFTGTHEMYQRGERKDIQKKRVHPHTDTGSREIR